MTTARDVIGLLLGWVLILCLPGAALVAFWTHRARATR